MTYTVVQRNNNSWTFCEKKQVFEIVNTCGHQHRTLRAAEQCLNGYRRKDAGGMISELGYFGQIEDANGEVVDANY